MTAIFQGRPFGPASESRAERVLRFIETGEEVEHDLLANPAAPAPKGAYTLTNHGGSVLPNPRLVLVFCGDFFLGRDGRDDLQRFALDLMAHGYLDGLAPYGSGRGSYWGAVDGPVPPSPFSDTDAGHYVAALIAAGAVPAPDGHTLYSLILPEGVEATWQGRPESSCSAFCGYHTAIAVNGQMVPFAVHPTTTCQNCHGAETPFQALTMVVAHEVAEVCTDMVPGLGWYEDGSGAENADLCAWQVAQYGPWTVQPYWTNEQGATVGPYDAPPPPPPPPPADCKAAALGAVKKLRGTLTKAKVLAALEKVL